jgi:DNA-binding NtrC family response regulator
MNPPLLLVIDDEKGVRESLRMVFSKDFRILEADSVDAALPQVRQEKPAVVLLDLLMPKTDGMEVLRQIKAIHPQCEVIMLTAVSSKHAAVKALECGAFDFVAKPFDVIDLREKVEKALRKVAEKTQLPS